MLTNKFFLTSSSLILSMFFIMMCTESIYIKWLMMEFSTIISIGLINIDSGNKKISILYYIMSTISGLFVIIVVSMNFSFLMIKDIMINNILMISMFLKLGIFPFWFWMIYIYNIATWPQIFLLSTIMKFIPIYFFSDVIYMSMNMFGFICLNNLLISMYANYKFNMKKLLGCSSIFNSSYLLLMLYMNNSLFILLSVIYLINFAFLIYMMSYYNISNMEFNYVPENVMNLIKIMMFTYSSFPMFSTFIFKWEFFMLLSSFNMNNNMVMMILISNVVMIWNYFIVVKYMNLKFETMLPKIELNSPYISMMILMIFAYSFTFLLYNII
uniref:NADH dehydrogenase subunit 2 n=1 Tax=Bombus waltoni TaxID=395577 RepID=A0A649WEA4_9HYME|nr:NADH dehydrogenase subunit 2 [Bombus waltoni]QGK86766.1 NADH dehydrogenase subunit 2 [Bombus waltoni]